MNKTLRLITAPETTPVSLTEIKNFLLVDNSSEDAFLSMLIKAVTQGVEKYLNRSLMTQQWKLTLDYFDCKGYIILPNAPVQNIDSIETFALDNSSSLVDESIYSLVTDSKVVLNYGYQWPINLRDNAGVSITYTAGYGDAADVPEAIKLAIYLWASAAYYQRGLCEMPDSCTSALNPYRIYPIKGMG
jgi:uncharacterized phiE125 gp8 family phage protein